MLQLFLWFYFTTEIIGIIHFSCLFFSQVFWCSRVCQRIPSFRNVQNCWFDHSRCFCCISDSSVYFLKPNDGPITCIDTSLDLTLKTATKCRFNFYLLNLLWNNDGMGGKLCHCPNIYEYLLSVLHLSVASLNVCPLYCCVDYSVTSHAGFGAWLRKKKNSL